MIPESTILSLQATAAAFMAADYFFTDRQRGRINERIQQALAPAKRELEKDLREYLVHATENAVAFGVALVFIFAGWLGVKFLLPILGSFAHPWVFALFALFLLGLFAGGLPRLLLIALGYLLPLALKSGTHSVIWFLIRCPKGSVFGLGFVLLVISFGARWHNL